MLSILCIILFFALGSLSFFDGLHPFVYHMQMQAQVFVAFCIGYICLNIDGGKAILAGFSLYNLYVLVSDPFFSDVTAIQWALEIGAFSAITLVIYLLRNKLWCKL